MEFVLYIKHCMFRFQPAQSIICTTLHLTINNLHTHTHTHTHIHTYTHTHIHAHTLKGFVFK